MQVQSRSQFSEHSNGATSNSKKVLLRRPKPARQQEAQSEPIKPIDTSTLALETPPASVIRQAGNSFVNNHQLVSKSDKKWVLDSECNSRNPTANSKIYVKNILHPHKPRGPDGLAPREPRRQFPGINEYLKSDEDIRYSKPPLFTLNDFTLKVAEVHKISVADARKIVLSTANYKRITQMVAQRMQQHYQHLTFVDVDLDALETIEDVQQRVPPSQVLLEMAAMIKEQVKESLNFEVECRVKRLPKFAPGYRIGEAPHSEIVLFEKKGDAPVDRIVRTDRLTGHPTHESLFSSGALLKHFQDNTRASSPFTHDENQISPAEICVLDCLLTGGIALSLKANFISELPDIAALSRTLTYINLSYNNFKEIPPEIFCVSSLQILKMRNNPLAVLPETIGGLKQLESLILPFCLITVLPISLYNLRKLRILDLAYNRISFLHQEIKRLRCLAFLNLDGNELTSLPHTLLSMRLKRIRVRNNFLHPLMWPENSVNHPQQLQDLAALTFWHSGLNRRYSLRAGRDSQQKEENGQFEGGREDESGDVQEDKEEEDKLDEDKDEEDKDEEDKDEEERLHRVPEEARRILVDQRGVCDCCGGPKFGPGLRLIRPANRLFGVRYLPLLFTACSPHCRQVFLKAEAQVPERLYQSGSDSESA